MDDYFTPIDTWRIQSKNVLFVGYSSASFVTFVLLSVDYDKK